MSVQFGQWNFDGQPAAPDYIGKVSRTLASYGLDSQDEYCKDGVNIVYRAFCTTKESLHEKQPYVSSSGAVITWDGRLDNRKELICELSPSLSADPTDVAIVAAAYEKWGDKSLPKLIGDWALSIWNPQHRSVLLAKDPIGTKHLYYAFDDQRVRWCTILDPLVLFANKTFDICEEYIAGWFAFNASAHLTPYVGIRTVSPSSCVLLQPRRHGIQHIVSRYWDFDPDKKIRYRSDAEYAEHFRTLLATAVQRRLRSDRPVLAELSGGLDSSSIVCMADLLMERGQAECPRLDTISWYDDSYDHIEPQSNELRWISKVEEKRGRAGCHINFRELKTKENSPRKMFGTEFDGDHFAATPSPRVADSSDRHFQIYAGFMKSNGHRVTLSGIGGGEFTGGFVPDPTVELQNLLSRAQFVRVIRQLNAWTAKMRKPRLPLLSEALNGFLSSGPTDDDADMRSTPWLHPGFVRRNQAALRCYLPSRVKLFGPLPSFQDNFARLEALRRLMSNYCLVPEMLREARYPFLDRDLLEFLFAIPREQVVGLGKRRFVMKRAITGLIPDELLNRRPKEFSPPETPDASSTESLRWPELNQDLVSDSLGIVQRVRLLEALQKARRKEDVPTGLDRTLVLESWLRHLVAHKVLANPIPTRKESFSPALQVEGLRAPPPNEFS
jgi:asparagine synthase (glutamine-hydrolysing)